MEKESKVTVKESNEVKVNDIKNVTNENVTEVEEIETANKLMLIREPFVSEDGREFYAYMVCGKVGERDIKIDFATKDKGGYEVLDILFEVSDKVELKLANETMVNNSGVKTRYMTYTAVAYDKDGIEYPCPIKPAQPSDRALLTILLNQKGGAK